MLILTRRIGESVVIEPSQDINPDMTVRELFAAGPIVVAFLGLNGKQTKLGIQASIALAVGRDELLI